MVGRHPQNVAKKSSRGDKLRSTVDRLHHVGNIIPIRHSKNTPTRRRKCSDLRDGRFQPGERKGTVQGPTQDSHGAVAQTFLFHRHKSRRTGKHCLHSTTNTERSQKQSLPLPRGQTGGLLPFADGRTLDQASSECPFLQRQSVEIPANLHAYILASPNQICSNVSSLSTSS
jgi:hypothetical protein